MSIYLCLTVGYVMVWFMSAVVGYRLNELWFTHGRLCGFDHAYNKDVMGFYTALWPVTMPLSVVIAFGVVFCSIARRVAGIKEVQA